MTTLMDLDELGKYLKIEKQTLYNWLHQRKLPGIKVGHVWRFDKKSIDAWLRSHSVGSTGGETARAREQKQRKGQACS